MKKIFFTLLSFLIISSAVQAQHVNIGVKGGLNLYTIQGDNSSSFKLFPSYHVGLLGHIHLDKTMALQPEIVYSVQGNQDSNNGDPNLTLNYINIPVLFQYMYDNGFRIEAGPNFGILASAKSGSTDVKANYNDFDIGISVGVSYVKPSTGYGYDIRYNHGLYNININDANKAYNRGIQIGFFYLFNHR